MTLYKIRSKSDGKFFKCLKCQFNEAKFSKYGSFYNNIETAKRMMMHASILRCHCELVEYEAAERVISL
jgi:hypothetical protein